MNARYRKLNTEISRIDLIGILAWSVGGAVLGALAGIGDTLQGAVYGAIAGSLLAAINIAVLSAVGGKRR
jgi:hypothetical protein